MTEDQDHHFMGEALRQAKKAFAADEVPVGAVVVFENQIIAKAYNQVELLKDATAHAEMIAITQAAAALGNWRLTGCDLYVTKEPCPMCAGAMVLSRLRKVFYGAPDAKSGAAGGWINLLNETRLNHRCETAQGLRQDECAGLLVEFFKAKRALP